jgi:hypothetical protein
MAARATGELQAELLEQRLALRFFEPAKIRGFDVATQRRLVDAVASAGKREPPGYLKIVLPLALRGQLDAAAAASGLSVSEEIRRRVARSFALDLDPVREVADAALWMADEIGAETGPQWWKHRTPFEVFAAALRSWLDSVQPPEDRGIDLTAYRGSDVPTLGASLARRYARHRDTLAKTEDYERKLKQLYGRPKK